MSRSIEPPTTLFPKTTVYSGSISHRFVDADIIEVSSPATHNPSILMKPKGAILHAAIDVDNDDESPDLVLIGEKVSKSDKGKEVEAIHDYGDQQVMEMFEFCPPATEKSEPGSGVESSDGWKNLEVSHNLINVDGHVSDQSYDDDSYSNLSDDYLDIADFALQAKFDNVDIPPRIEAPIPWLSEYGLGLKMTGSSSLYPWNHPQSDAKHSHVTDTSQLSGLFEPINPETQQTSAGSSTFQIKMDAVGHPSGTALSSPQLSSETPSKKESDAKQSRRQKLKLSLGLDSSKSQWFSGPSEGKKKPYVFPASTNYGFADKLEAMKVPDAGEPPYWSLFGGAKMLAGSNSSHDSNVMGTADGTIYHTGTGLSNHLWWKFSPHFNAFTTASSDLFYSPDPLYVPVAEPAFDNTWVHNSARDGNNETATNSTIVTISDEAREEILWKFQNFKKFDTIENTSDHHFVDISSSMKQHPKNWAKRIQEEWKILEKDLPDSILVRVYESRIDLLRAVIIGAEGTPYHDGLFFFDVSFPSSYPNAPPQVHYHSGGLRLNPNLYHCGKVCLSLLNTWSGDQNEKWIPGVSTILQVLVSIQGLILNTKPYFNEPGFAHLSGSASGEIQSLQYNEDTFILSLRTMVYLMRRPPKNFGDFVTGHFCNRAHDILVACKAYMDGAQVGCLVKGGVQDLDQGDRSCSTHFKTSLAAYVDMLVKEFARIGAKECDKLLSSSTAERPLG